MRLQWPRFSLKPEPDRAQDPCTARIGSTGDLNVLKAELGFPENTKVEIGNSCTGFLETMQKKKVERNSVLIGLSSKSDTANANKVSNLLATADARWWSVAGQAVKCGNYATDGIYSGMVVQYGADLPYLSYRGPTTGFLSQSVFCSRRSFVVDDLRRVRDAEPHMGTFPCVSDCALRTGVGRGGGYVAEWHAYPQETTGHYCRRFQEAMWPHILQDINSPQLQTLVILRNGLPPQIRQHVPMPTPDMTVGHMIEYILDAEIVAHAIQADAYVVEPQVPVDDAGLGEPQYEAGPIFPEDPIPAVPVYEVPAQEVGIEVEADDQDAADNMDAPEDQPEDPPIIDISSDDEDDGEEPDHEPGYGGWLDEDDPEEILYDDGDWDADSDSDASVITIEYTD
ncbi:hypothetical protein TIFTF001_046002 [Ficus carica]|uniref:Uncharacterized protein n=1 Tax=Ficus carica TaxID=3494 RepID=A0AA87YXK8_FICCA|nr:hypothetical protein TIFTF001_046002 [Ficus carica]